MTLKELVERRGGVAAQIRKMADALTEGGTTRGFTSEERVAWDRINKEYDELCESIDALRRASMISSEEDTKTVGRADVGHDRVMRSAAGGSDTVDSDENARLAFLAWLSYGRRALDERSISACRVVGIDPSASAIDVRLSGTERFRAAIESVHPTLRAQRMREVMEREKRTMTSVSGLAGGWLVPPRMVGTLEINMLLYGAVESVAQVITTPSGEDLIWPGIDDTGNIGEQLGEGASWGTFIAPTVRQQIWRAYKFHSRPIAVSSELIQDANFNLDEILGAIMGERLGRASNLAFTTGDGASGPHGIVVGSSLGVTSASSTAYTADELIRLAHSVDPAYRSEPGAGWMMHDTQLAYARMLKTSDGQYLWSPGIESGIPDRLYGFPVTVNQDMQPTTGAGAQTSGTRPVIFGSLSRYKIRRVGTIRIVRSSEAQVSTDQVVFNAYIRQDGALLNMGTPPVRHLLIA